MNEELRQIDRTYVIWRERRLSYFAGCDYFRLASHPEVLSAVKEGLDRCGLNVAASRITTGNHPLFTELESALAKFFGAPAALLTGNGYATNPVVVQALGGEFSHILIDTNAHVSQRDAVKFFAGKVMNFKHRDAVDLARKLRKLGGKSRPLVMTDGMFSRDGEIAPLPQYLKALPANGMLLVDDAHAAGLLGATGKGTPEYCNVSRKRIIQAITLSKAFGCYGGAILCDARTKAKLAGHSHMFAGSTPMPLPLAFAAMRSMEILRQDPGLRCRLTHNVNYIKSALRAVGRPVANTPSPIASIVPASAAETKKFRAKLLSREIFPSFIRYPGGPEGGYFRFVVSSQHSMEQVSELVAALTEPL